MSRRHAFIGAALACAIAGSGLFIAAYATWGDRLYEGMSLALAAAGFAAAALGWAFWLLPRATVVDEVDGYPSNTGELNAALRDLASAESAMTRPRWLVRMLYLAGGAIAAALVVPLRSLGPGPPGALFHTRWRRGDRLVRLDGTPVRGDELNVDAAIVVFPESAPRDPQSQTTLIRLPPDAPDSANGYVAYSRLCTHAGCPVALYRAETKQLVCPCHQSVFDVTANGTVAAGPADHPLPRLPIVLDGDGALRAAGDFPVPVGPGFWERS